MLLFALACTSAAPDGPKGTDEEPVTDSAACSATTTYADADGDGFGDPATGISACDAPTDRTLDATDCDDTDASVFPGAPEACDGRDDDCDGATDEDPTDPLAFYTDADADGWGDAVVLACALSEGLVERDGDCDDADPTVNPGAAEDCTTDADDDCTDGPAPKTKCSTCADGSSSPACRRAKTRALLAKKSPDTP
jgi:hypothetical protein